MQHRPVLQRLQRRRRDRPCAMPAKALGCETMKRLLLAEAGGGRGSRSSRSPAPGARNRRASTCYRSCRRRGFRPGSSGPARSSSPAPGCCAPWPRACAAGTPVSCSMLAMCVEIFGADVGHLGVGRQIIVAVRHAEAALVEDRDILFRALDVLVDVTRRTSAGPNPSSDSPERAGEARSCSSRRRTAAGPRPAARSRAPRSPLRP